MEVQTKSFEEMSPIEQAVTRLTAVRKGLADILKAPEHQVFAIRADSDLKRLQAFLQAATGNVVVDGQADNIQGLIDSFGPVTTFMGHDVDRPQPIKAEDINPSEADKEAFLAKRDSLYERISDMSDEDVLKGLLEPKGETVLRSVAKKAGLYGYREDEINAESLANIRVAIAGHRERHRIDAEAENLRDKQRNDRTQHDQSGDATVDAGKRLVEQQKVLDEAKQREQQEDAKGKDTTAENKSGRRGPKS